VAYFFRTLTKHPDWQQAVRSGLLSCPLSEGWENRLYHTHIVPIWTRNRHEQFLFFHLMSSDMNAYSFSYPVVPKGKSRVRMVFHAHNTRADVDKTVESICDWIREMFDLEARVSGDAVPRVASEVYARRKAIKA
jgi:8-amino-7-oxononanoate synthase